MVDKMAKMEQVRGKKKSRPFQHVGRSSRTISNVNSFKLENVSFVTTPGPHHTPFVVVKLILKYHLTFRFRSISC